MKTLLLSVLILLSASINAQNCLRILPGTSFSGPDLNGKFTLTVNYETDGNKTLETIIKCGSTVILSDCFQVSGVGTKTYNNLTCGSLVQLSAIFTPRTGSCNSAQCGPDVLIGNEVLASKINMLYAKRINSNTFTVYFNVLEDINTYQYTIKLSTDGINFKTRAIIFPDNTKTGKYQITIKL